MSHAVRLVDPEPPGTATRQEFEAETALADAGLGDDAHHLSVARLGAGERRFQGMQVRVPAHEAREAARSRHLEAGAKKDPGLAVLKRLARALGVPVTELLE